MNKGMCVLLFDVFKHLLLRKTDVLREILKKCTSFEQQKGIFGKTFILALLSLVAFHLQKRVSNFF